MTSDEPLIVPLPKDARVITRWPIPVVVEPGAVAILGLAVLLGCAFSLLNSIAAGHDYPTLGDLTLGIAAALLWPVAMVLHEVGHAAAGLIVGRHPVWARAGLAPCVVLTPPPVERWARILVSASGPVVELSAGLLIIVVSPVTGRVQFLTDPWAMVGGVCVLNAVSNLLPGPKFTDGGKLWRAAWEMATSTPARRRPG